MSSAGPEIAEGPSRVTAGPAPGTLGPLVAGLTIFSAATALRPPILVLGPLAPQMIDDLGVSHAAMGMLGTASVLLVGLASPLGPRLTARVGLRAAMAVVLAALLATGLARALAPGYELILVLTLAIGALIGLGQSQPPVLARLTSLAPQIGSLALTIGLVGSSVAVAAVAVPLSTTFGGWRWAVALVTLPVVASLIAWLAIVRPRATTANAERAHLPWRDRVAWLLAACFGLQGALYTSLTTWLPEMFVEQGWDEASAGALVSALNLFALISNVGLLLAGTRLAATSLAVAVVSVTSLAAAVGLAAGLPPILPVALMGVSLGAVLPLLVTLAIRRAPSAADAGALTAMMFTLGYVTAGLGPVIVGVARDASGAFALPSWLLVADALALVVVAIRVHRAAASARGRPGDEYPTAGTHVSEMST